MDKRPIGGTGLKVTPICFGTSGLGDMPATYGYSVDEDRARATVTAILDGPVNMLDTSNNYGFGRSEERIGAVIRERGGLPAGFVLATKLDRDMETGRFDAGRVRRSVEESLTRLGLERNDGEHCLHGGHSGFAKREWSIEELGTNRARFSIVSAVNALIATGTS